MYKIILVIIFLVSCSSSKTIDKSNYSIFVTILNYSDVNQGSIDIKIYSKDDTEHLNPVPLEANEAVLITYDNSELKLTNEFDENSIHVRLETLNRSDNWKVQFVDKKGDRHLLANITLPKPILFSEDYTNLTLSSQEEITINWTSPNEEYDFVHFYEFYCIDNDATIINGDLNSAIMLTGGANLIFENNETTVFSNTKITDMISDQYPNYTCKNQLVFRSVNKKINENLFSESNVTLILDQRIAIDIES